MPINEKTALNIVCDNPACPGNALDKSDRAGWLFVSTEIYGDPPQQHVYCSPECAGADAPASFSTPDELKPHPPVDPEELAAAALPEPT